MCWPAPTSAWGSPRSATRRSSGWCWRGSSSRHPRPTRSASWTRSAWPRRGCGRSSAAWTGAWLVTTATLSARPVWPTPAVRGGQRWSCTRSRPCTCQAEKEDQLRRVGMSKEHRVDPQVQVGLLVDPGGFPLEIHLVEGNKAETKTLIPVLSAFAERHGVTDMVVVADAGMLSAGNLNALQDAGFSFIVGSRIAKAPYDLAEHFTRHGDYFADAQILESARAMGTGTAARPRRVIYQYKFTRYSHDNPAINAMVARAEKITTGATAMAKARFVKVTGATKELDQALIDRARQLAGLKGYVTNLPATTMDGQAVIDAYHDLYQVERSFRMAKSDLRARPIFHHDRDAIEAHLTVVFAALAVARELQAATGVSLKKLVQTLRPLRTRDDRHRRPHD